MEKKVNTKIVRGDYVSEHPTLEIKITGITETEKGFTLDCEIIGDTVVDSNLRDYNLKIVKDETAL